MLILLRWLLQVSIALRDQTGSKNGAFEGGNIRSCQSTSARSVEVTGGAGSLHILRTLISVTSDESYYQMIVPDASGNTDPLIAPVGSDGSVVGFVEDDDATPVLFSPQGVKRLIKIYMSSVGLG